jgi:hypothetical protein
MREKYKNPEIDRELNNFKMEIEEKFKKSEINPGYAFQRKHSIITKSIEEKKKLTYLN